MEYQFHYTKFPALKSYIDRIGASQLNHRRFMVKEFHGHYYVEKVLIKINDDFSIDCRDKSYLPTQEEGAAIAAELKVSDFPVSVTATQAQVDELLKSGKIEGVLYTFYDAVERKKVLMCQERREKDGGKYYIPWSLYATKGAKGMWESMEPAGALPFWKPPAKRNKSIIMVHEGAKTAAFVDGLLNDRTRLAERKDFERMAPDWISHLSDCEHWGAIGGALAMHRCDFDELLKMKIESHLEYSCDNDPAGREASKTFSKNLSGKTVRVITYDDPAFRPGWDLADPLPIELVDKKGRFRLRLDDSIKPATWATSKVKGEGKGAPAHVLTMKFREEWSHCSDIEMFFHNSVQGIEYDERAFNSAVRPYSDVDNTARLIHTSKVGKVNAPNYDPARPWGIYTDGPGKNLFFNRCITKKFAEYSAAEAKRLDHSLITKFFEHLIPDSGDRHETIKWVATVCVCPNTRVPYAMLVCSQTQGVGKSTVGKIMTGIVGRDNVSVPNESALTNERNTWIAYKRVGIIHEIYQGHTSAVYNRLKSPITEDQIWANPKYIQEHLVDNHIAIYANSNSLAPLKFDNNDRRWLVPKCTETKLPHSFWIEFNDFMDNNDGHRSNRQFFKDFIRDNGPVLPGAEAPYTMAKRDMIMETFTYSQEVVQNALEWILSPDMDIELNGTQSEMSRIREAVKRGIPIIAFDKDGVEGMDRVIEGKGMTDIKMNKAAAICRVARLVGFHVGARNETTHFARRGRVLSLSEELASTKVSDLARRVEAKEVIYARLGLLMEEKVSL
jgi:hypothetical protein